MVLAADDRYAAGENGLAALSHIDNAASLGSSYGKIYMVHADAANALRFDGHVAPVQKGAHTEIYFPYNSSTWGTGLYQNSGYLARGVFSIQN